MKIFILNLVPKSWIMEDFGDTIKVYYINKKGFSYSNPVPVVFPKIINVDKNLIEGLALYLGDGSFQENKTHASFVNKDKDICKFMWDFFRERFGLSINDISCFISYRRENPKLIREWSTALGIPKNKFKVKYSVRHREEALQLQINRTIFRQIFEALTRKVINSNFLEDKQLGRAFLRGLFAAEGHIGLAKDSPKPYVNYMSYHFSIFENKLIRLVSVALSNEGIKHKLMIREQDNSAEIRITGWDNYWKLWRAELFGLCERKFGRFREVARILDVNCLLNKQFRKKIFAKTGLTQRQLAVLLNSWQGNVCKMVSGELGISLDRLITLSKLSDTNINLIKRNINNVVIGSLTPVNDRDFIKLILDLKLNNTN